MGAAAGWPEEGDERGADGERGDGEVGARFGPREVLQRAHGEGGLTPGPWQPPRLPAPWLPFVRVALFVVVVLVSVVGLLVLGFVC